MYRNLLSFLFLFVSAQLLAQDKVEWTYSYNSSANHIEIKAVIAEGWHLYSQQIDNEIGPIPTAFEFQRNPHVKFVGETVEPESIKAYDPNFEGDLNFFKDQVVFKQKIKIDQPTEVIGVVTYMVCNDVMCMPPTDELFTIRIE